MKEFLYTLFPIIEAAESPKISLKYILYVGLVALFLFNFGFIVEQLHFQSFTKLKELLVFIIPAFISNALIPIRFRPAVLVAAFVGACVFVFGWVASGILIALLLLAFIILNLPFSLWLKSGLIILFLCALAYLRLGFIYMPRVQLVIAYCAALIMFRSIIWLYETSHTAMKESIWMRLSYFFCLPNLALLFFPIIDYRTHIDSYNSISSYKIWRTGFIYVFLGLLQYLIYRIMHNLLVISAADLTTVYQFTQYLFANYFTLLKFSGTLTVGAGFLCFLGFNLPSPFGNYFFAESFGEYWRKVNIYWRDFLMKIVYYPTFFAIRKKVSNATEVSILVVFASSIFFHWYQKFWITGFYTLKWNDFIFWGSLGFLIILNERFITYFKQQKEPSFFVKHFFIAIRTTIVLLVMSWLMLFWNAPSLTETWYIMHRSFNSSNVLVSVGFILALLFFINFGQSIIYSTWAKYINTTEKNFIAVLIGFGLLVVLVLKIYYLANSSQLYNLIATEKQTSSDIEKEEADYYGSIFQAASSGWQNTLIIMKSNSAFKAVTVQTGDILMRKLKVSISTVVDGYLFTTNSFGVRDKEYSTSKPDTVFRAILLGSSYELGLGVSDTCVFEYKVEQELNKQKYKVELINFSMGLYTCIQQVYLMDKKVLPYQPDAVFVFNHVGEMERFPNFFTRYILSGTDLYYPFLKEIKTKAGIQQSMSELEIKERLKPYTPALIQWAYNTIANTCLKHKIQPIWVYTPTTTDIYNQSLYLEQKGWAEKAGFTCVSMQNAFNGLDKKAIQVSLKDSHPNCLGHQLLADQFLPILQQNILLKWNQKKLKQQ